MQQIITAKLKLLTTMDQFAALRATQLAYRDALNAVSRSAFANGKTSSVTRLHKSMYAELRGSYGLPSQLACSVERQVAATYKGLWTKLKKNAEHRRAKLTKKRFKGLDQSPHYSSPTVQYTYERDYTFQRESRVSVGTLNGRISVPYQGYEQHLALIRQGAAIGDAKLWYDRPKKRFYLLVSLTIDLADPTPAHLSEVVGVDVGIRVRLHALEKLLLEQHLNSGVRGKRHASGNGISRGVRPADNVPLLPVRGKEGLPLRPMLT